MSKRATIVWVDAQGERTLSVIDTSTGVGSIETSMLNHINADHLQCTEGILETYSASPSTSTYNTVRVAAICTFVDSTGSEGSVILYSPKDNIFMPDGDTVDPSSISDLITACVGNLLAGSGNTVVNFKGGRAIRTRLSGIATVQ